MFLANLRFFYINKTACNLHLFILILQYVVKHSLTNYKNVFSPHIVKIKLYAK